MYENMIAFLIVQPITNIHDFVVKMTNYYITICLNVQTNHYDQSTLLL